LLKVPYKYLVVVIVVVCVMGAYSVNYAAFDVGAMLFFGIFGYFIRKGGFPAAPLILAMILGPILERSLQQSLMMSGGDPGIFFRRGISITLLSVGGLLVLKPIMLWLWKNRRGNV
jgi:putative tricarboxylic transport membrane protein